MQKLHLDGSPISLQRFIELAEGPVAITLAPAIRERLVRARDIVARYAAGDQPVYGLNTGLGGNLKHRIDAKDIPAFPGAIASGPQCRRWPQSSRMDQPLPPGSRASSVRRAAPRACRSPRLI